MSNPDPSTEGAAIQLSLAQPGAALTLSARPLFWPLDMCWAVLRPLEFFKRQIYRLGVGGSIISAVVNLLLTPLIVFGAVALRTYLQEGLTPFDEAFYDPFARGMMIALVIQFGVLWLVVVALAGFSSLLYTTAISGCETFGRAFRRSLALVAGVTSVGPAIGILIAMVVLTAEAISSVLKPLVGGMGVSYVMTFGIWLLFAWPTALTLLALACNGLHGPRAAHAKGEKRCEKCGYSLVVLPEERQCPDCGWSADDSLLPRRRRPLLVESPGWFPRIPGALAAMWSGFWSPSRFWWRFQVRRGSTAPRNAFLTLVPPGAAAGAFLAIICITAAILIDGGNIDQDAIAALLFGFLFSFLATLGVVLLAGQAGLLIGVAVARLRGNMMRIDELARVGYCSLGLPAVVASIAAPLAVACFFSGFAVSFASMGPGPGSPERIALIVFWCVAFVAAVVTVAAALGSLISMVRGMQAARHANF